MQLSRTVLVLGIMAVLSFQGPVPLRAVDMQSELEKYDPTRNSENAPTPTAAPAGTGTGASSSKTGTVKVNTRLNIRATPWGKILGHFQNGDQVQITGRQGDWLKITWNGRQAFVHSKYVKVRGSTSTPGTSGGQVSSSGTPGSNGDSPSSNDGTTNNGTIPAGHSHLDPGGRVPRGLLASALAYYDTNRSSLRNPNVITVIDFSQHSSLERMHIIDMRSGRVSSYATAHGQGSDPDGDGFATRFSNTASSKMSSQGIYVTAETYQGENGFSLRLDGKSGTNSNARSRAIVIHPANYVRTGGSVGRSWGCPALDPRFATEVINRIKSGSVIYAK